MSAVKKQRIDLRLTDDDKSMIEEAAAISNQSVSQFMLNSASQRAALPSRKPKHLKTISLTKIRDNNNEKSSDCRVNCRF